MPVIDLSNEAESSPEAGPSSLQQDPNDSVVLLRDTDQSTAGHRRKRRRLAASRSDVNDDDDDDDLQVVNNSRPASSNSTANTAAARRGQSAGGLPLHLPSRPNGTFVNLADDSLARDDDYVQPLTSFSAGPPRRPRSNEHLELDDQERSLAGGALASVYGLCIGKLFEALNV